MNEKYTLQFPFTSAAGERIDVLQLRRLKVKICVLRDAPAINRKSGMSR